MADNYMKSSTEIRRYKPEGEADEAVRLFNSSPEGATLQIRGTSVNTPMLAMATLNRERLTELHRMIAETLADM